MLLHVKGLRQTQRLTLLRDSSHDWGSVRPCLLCPQCLPPTIRLAPLRLPYMSAASLLDLLHVGQLHPSDLARLTAAPPPPPDLL
jgi:hypothetical protein